MSNNKLTLYKEFDWESYKNLNPFLYIIGLRTKEEYTINYFTEGILKSRICKESELIKKSFHVLLATIGNKSIFGILNMLKNQLSEIDFLTIVFDGIDKSQNIDLIKIFCKDFICKINIIIENENLGFWGHGIRNKHNDLEGDFVFHIDDDDILFDNSFEIIRKYCINNDIIYLFKIMLENNSIIWKKPEIKYANLSTQSGIIPTKINKTGFWELKYGGDYGFYKKLCEKNIYVFMDHLIYRKIGNGPKKIVKYIE